MELETLAVPGRDKQEVVHWGWSAKAKLLPSTNHSSDIFPKASGVEWDTGGLHQRTDVFCDFGVEGTPGVPRDNGISHWQKGINRWHWARGELTIYTFRQQIGSATSGDHTPYVC